MRFVISSVFETRLEKCRQTIRHGLEVMQKPYLSCSWGKDSVLTLWLVRQVNESIPVVFMDSGYAFPETYQLRDRLLAEWNIQNYIEIPPNIDYFDLCQIYGLPGIDRTDATQKKVVDLLKKNKANSWAQGHGYDGHFWGLRADESRGRRVLLRKNGLLYQGKTGLWRCSPIGWLSTREVWDIIFEQEIPYSGIYDRTQLIPREKIRNSGWLTTDGAADGRIVWLKRHYPELYFRLVAEFPQVKSYT